MKVALLMQGLWLQISLSLVEMTSETEARREKHNIWLKLYSLQLTVKCALIMSSAITKVSSRASLVFSGSKNLGHSSTYSTIFSTEQTNQPYNLSNHCSLHMKVISWLACKAVLAKRVLVPKCFTGCHTQHASLSSIHLKSIANKIKIQ